ncbi:hypothetical protein [Shewanella sp. SG41-3]|uniref:hypothetical protein n=1 Tax=Shewanella sp. SG41-3 TaxID=2760977 RepID=UPI00160275B1|nr:hypothetical protein [Shewanella sp. SG41-3]MBB1477839.1 hypothetical protein [Shewanella sp. SG41-3]
MENSNILKIENSKKCVWWKFENIEFYWEVRTGDVFVKGDGVENKLSFAPAEEATAAGARKAIKQWLAQAYGV